MAVHPIEERYGTKEMRAVWSEKNRFSCIVSTEVALAKAEAHHGMIPAAAAVEISEKAHNASLERAKAIELEISHDMMAIVKAISEVYGRVRALGALRCNEQRYPRHRNRAPARPDARPDRRETPPAARGPPQAGG